MRADRYAKLRVEIESGQRIWKAAGQTKDALVRFQREVVLPLRKLREKGAVMIAEDRVMQRGAHFVERVEIRGEVRLELL